MGFMDKLKNAASSVSEKAGQMVKEAEQKAAQKKAENEAMQAEKTAKVEAMRDEAVSKINSIGTGGGIVDSLSEKELLDFTKSFAEKLFISACTASSSHIVIYPYITEKQIKKIHNSFKFDESMDKPIIHIRTEDKQEILFTKNKLFFRVILPEDKNVSAVGEVNASAVNDFRFVETEEGYSFQCDTVELISFKLNKKYKQDFITLNNYFDRIKNKQFEITEQEIHDMIKEKVGEKIYGMFSKYYADDDELAIFFAWGADSYSANDFVICTTNQVIILDRELGGMTMNAKQLYYDDITAVEIIQNSNSGSLTADLINSAITAALDVCDLNISAAGASIRINNLYKNEAERIAAIYHQKRKELKTKSAAPTIVQAAAPVASDPLEQLEKLSKLKDAGIISAEEFEKKKADLLAKL